MNLQQFRYLREAVRQKLNLTSAARSLHTSQPGVSKAIIELEQELGVSIFARHGKRILGLTPPGQQVLDAAERIMNELDNLKKLARDYAGSPEGTLRLATTHTQARYVLPEVVQRFARKFPSVRLKLLQGNPPQIAAMVASGQADVGMATETLADTPGLVSIPVYQWEHVAVVPAEHPLARFAAHATRLTLKELGRHPIVTYEMHFSGRSRIDAAFAEAGIEPSIVLEAIDADVIKTYARAGLGVGIVAGVATEHNSDGLVVIGCGHLFGRNTTRLAIKQGVYLRGFVYSFIEMVAPGWDRHRIEQQFRKRPGPSKSAAT
ncbi:HTH-type transcriptional regulator cbl [Burkholderiales bacterium]|jgi:LysR family cys regulon transcriptional activator|nr:HTH-type transcriptional regulator cbl [Burkholderiales bacterium]